MNAFEERLRRFRMFEEYDLVKLRKAHRLLMEVYEYYYDYPPTKKMESRLLTIINKLEYLINANGK